ncbi:MAG: hypothetical protein LBK73_09690 [Treponema sp.]|jgi:hypothetical protein|nr:hypothetical protein [Treponema sp.]
MAHYRNFLDAGDAAFNNGLENLVDYVIEKTSGTPPAWSHIPPSAVTALESARANWRTAYQKTFGAHTPVDTEAKNDAHKAATAVTRPFIAQYLMFPPVTNEDRAAGRSHQGHASYAYRRADDAPGHHGYSRNRRVSSEDMVSRRGDA